MSLLRLSIFRVSTSPPPLFLPTKTCLQNLSTVAAGPSSPITNGKSVFTACRSDLLEKCNFAYLPSRRPVHVSLHTPSLKNTVYSTQARCVNVSNIRVRTLLQVEEQCFSCLQVSVLLVLVESLKTHDRFCFCRAAHRKQVGDTCIHMSWSRWYVSIRHKSTTHTHTQFRWNVKKTSLLQSQSKRHVCDRSACSEFL